MPDLGEILRAIETAEEELAVWHKLVSVLSDYLPRDSRQKTEKILRDNGAEVSEETINRIMEEISSYHVASLKTIVNNVKNMSIPSNTPTALPEPEE